MNAFEKFVLPDIQASGDARNLVIQKVGVKGVTHPVLLESLNGPQPSVAAIDMYVRLPATEKGTHMSRFLEVLGVWTTPISAASLAGLLDRMLERLEAESGSIEVRAPFFILKRAPVSGVESLLDYQAVFRAEADGDRLELSQSLTVPVTSLCPCSKEISAYGAHNQRSHITVTTFLAPGADLPVEVLAMAAESSASCELWGLLKRPDEKYVTERAYENPKFVEDLVRDVALSLAADPRVARYEIASENFESIHNHSAYAWLQGPQ